jgi:polyribonucleotide nucleotidyltransferase
MNKSQEKENKRFEFKFQGKEIVFEIDQLATRSDKSILARYGNTTVLTVLLVKELSPKKIIPFFPLTVSVEEKFYAVGRIPASFNRREGKPSYDAITTARLIDRSLRNFFPTVGHQEVQIINHILSVDPTCDPCLLAAWNSFLVCLLSPLLPFFSTPLALVTVSELEKEMVCCSNQESEWELIISATEEKITMLEVEAKEISEEKLMTAVEFAYHEIRHLLGFFRYIITSQGANKKKPLEEKKVENEWLEKKINSHLVKLLLQEDISWSEEEKELKKFCQQLNQEYGAKNPHLEAEYIEDLVEIISDNCLRDFMKEIWNSRQRRLDGRQSHEIRPLEIQIDYLPSVHGSALFTRGETKVLSVVTIGKISEKQLIDTVFFRSHKYFIHHYNFPNFAVNELINYRGTSRREIGHGQLVEKTFAYLIPPTSEFPHTVRTVSEVFSSDGSSSQASICATSLALMTAGVPLIRPVAGIALGLLAGQIYTDINGLEDKLGEMDFKIAGTEKGVCSLQLDVKNHGISQELLKECLEKGRTARLYLLSEMKKHIIHPRPSLPTQVIKCRQFYVGNEKISLIIGPGGKKINYITAKTGTTIEIQADGYVLIYHQEEKQLERAVVLIQETLASSSFRGK